MKEIMLSGRSDFGEVSKRRLSISIMGKSGKTSWVLTSTTTEREIMTLLLVDG